MSPACKDCVFYVKYPAENNPTGLCKRYPPIRDGVHSAYPITAVDDWCGEFKSSPVVVTPKAPVKPEDDCGE
jgi:hypothetical protein